MLIKAIVVDDEWYNAVEIVDLINNTKFMKVVKQFENGIEALEEIDKISPQVAFIDIQMPEIDGITLAEKLIEKKPNMIIVFITAWDQYAVQAFEVNALDYIMKPINVERFNKMVQKIRSKAELMQEMKMSKYAQLKIQCFGRLDVSIDGEKVIWQRTKAEELFAFLLMHNEMYIHKDIILEFLWPEYDRTKALTILQTSVCKIRNIFSAVKEKVRIDYKSNSYGLFLKNVDCDYNEVMNAISDFNINKPDTYKAIETAGKISEKGFLMQQGYLWSTEKNEEIYKELARNLKEMLEEYDKEHNVEKQLLILELLITIIPYDEEIYYKLFKTLESLGKYAEIAIRFKQIKDKLSSEYDIVPSNKIEDICKKYFTSEE